MIPSKTIPEPQDEAMDRFRKFFPLICKCFVSDCGCYMNYEMSALPFARAYLSRAAGIIHDNNLPLEASVWASTARPNHVLLTIKYKP